MVMRVEYHDNELSVQVNVELDDWMGNHELLSYARGHFGVGRIAITLFHWALFTRKGYLWLCRRPVRVQFFSFVKFFGLPLAKTSVPSISSRRIQIIANVRMNSVDLRWDTLPHVNSSKH